MDASVAKIARRLNVRNCRRLGLLARNMPALILMTDETRLPNPRPYLADLPRGSAVIVRNRDERAALALADRLETECRKKGIRLIISTGRPRRVCLRHGIHIPEKSFGMWVWRKTVRASFVTTSAHSAAAIRRAKGQANAILVSPLFETPSHPGKPAAPSRVLSMAPADAPLYGLGGITANTARKLQASRLLGFAGISFFT